MFDVTTANEYLKAANLGEWKIYPRDESIEAAEELQKVADKQKRGKKHFAKGTSKSAANIRHKSDVYIFESSAGRDSGSPVVFVIASGNSETIEEICGCEPSGAVAMQHIDAVKALTQTNSDFKYKVTENAQRKVAMNEALDPNEKAFVQVFLPPPPRSSKKSGEALIGGGLGFMGASFTTNLFLQNFGNSKGTERDKPKQPKKIRTDKPENTQEQLQMQQNAQEVFEQLCLVTLVRENLVLNGEQISKILKSIESGATVITEQGQQFSVVDEIIKNPSVIGQIEEFLNSQDNDIKKYIKENKIKRGQNYNKLLELLSKNKEENKENEEENKEENDVEDTEDKQQEYQEEEIDSDNQTSNERSEDSNKEFERTDQQSDDRQTTPEQDFENLKKHLENQLKEADRINSGMLPEPELEATNIQASPKNKYKKLTIKKGVKIKYVPANQYQRGK